MSPATTVGAARVIWGRYEMGGLIGQGGTADVRLARDLRSGRTVAIKMLRTHLARDARLRSRFRREGHMMAMLSHPNIVSVYETGYEVVDGVRVPLLVMEYVAGRSLRDLLADGGLTLQESVRYQLGILSALECSHRAGIVHRDIKPANVMVTPDGVVKVVDFGIARSTADSATATQTHAVLGTAHYLSPEQVRGEAVDARSDLYSAGCLLYELLTGRPPFTGDSPVSIAYQHVHEQPVPVSAATRTPGTVLDRVLDQALSKARKDRFQTAQAFMVALRSATGGERRRREQRPLIALSATPG